MRKLLAKFICSSTNLLTVFIVFSCIFLLGLSNQTFAQYAAGKIAVNVIGDGSVIAAGTAAPVFIKEFNVSGTGQSGTVRTSLPTTAVSGTSAVNRALTQNITAPSEGMLSLSADRQFLVLTGYNVSAGTAGVSASSSATFPTNTRVVGKIGANGTADTRTTLHTFTNSGIRGVATVNGSVYWVSGASGTSYVTDANVTASVVNLDATNARGIGIFNNQLYMSSASGAIRLARVGTGLPTTTGQTLTNLSGVTTSTADPYSFTFLNTDGTAGPDVVYIASLGTTPTGIVKYTSADQGATWTAKGSLTGFGVGITAVYNSCTGNADMYILSSTGGTAKPTFLYKYTDVSAATSTLSLAISSGTLLATAAANTAFGGVAFTPGSSFTLPLAYNVTGGTACTNVGVTIGLSNSEIGVSYQLMNGASPVGSAVTGTGGTIGFGVQTTVGTYTVIATNLLTGCTASMTGSATVNALPTVSITGSTSVCIGSTTTLSPTNGGTWASSSNAIATVTNAAVVTGVAAGTATFSFTQTSTGCTNTTSAVTVNALPTVSISGSSSVCVGSTTTLSPATSGTWASNNSSTATVTNAGVVTGVAAGTATFTYTQTSTGCTNTTLAVTVNALPTVSYSGLAASYCVSAGAVTLTGSPTGGTFGGPGISGNTFTPATAGVGGPYTITYTYTDGNGCTNTSNQTVTVNALPVVSFSGLPAVLCLNAASITLTGSPAGGTFSGPGISGNTFDPALAGAGGPHTITYLYTDGNGCTNTSSQTVMVNPLPTVSFTGLLSSYCADAPAVTLTGSPAGGTFSGPGISGNTFTPATAGVGGPYTITYTYTDGNGCTNTSSKTVNVSAVPVISGVTPATQCGVGTVVLSATGTGTGFNWYANANGGEPLGTGTNFTTAVINTTTTYYVAATNDGGNSTGGKASTNGADGFNTMGGISFTATSAFKLNSVKMYPIGAGTNTIVLYPGAGVTSGTPLFSTNYTFAAANTTTGETVPLGWEIPAGSYTIYQSVSNAFCYRDVPGGTSLPAIAYPYNIGGVITLTDGTLSGFYYYFYNWNITSGCESPRTAVTATVTPSPAIVVSPASLSICSGNITTTQLSVSSGNDPNYTYTWSSVPAGFTATGSGPFTVSPTATTTYNVYAQDNTSGNPSSGCGALGNTMITILPNNLSVDPTASPAAICSGGNTQLNANRTLGVSCIPVSSCTYPDIISNVSFGGINNTTGCNGASTSGFTYFTAPNPTIIAGTDQPLSVTTGGDVEGAAVWIDYNQNTIFESSEQVLNGYLGTNPAIYTATVNIPLTALNGTTRMRVRCRYGANPNSLANPACTDVTFGETEDYAITISGGVDPVPSNLTYDWSANPTFLSATDISNPQATGVNAAQTYTVTVTDPNTGCVKSGSVNVPLSIPAVVISAGTNCVSGTATQLIAIATAGTGASISGYQWSLNGNGIPGAISATYEATATGSYTVTVTSNLGCTATSDPYILYVINTALNGTYTINSSLPASCTNYISMAAAISDLNTKGVNGNVIFNVASAHTETAPSGGLTISYCALSASLKPSASQTVTFQGGSTAALITAPVGTSATVDGIVKLVGADYITFDKINLQESAANTDATTQMEWGYALLKCDGNNGSGHNTISHCSVTLNKANTLSRGIYSGNHNATVTTGLTYSGTAGNFTQVDSSRNGYNNFYANSIQNVYTAIAINGNSATSGTHSLNDTLNVIGITGQGNTISNFGGGSVAAIGITETNQRNLKVNGNTISGGAGNTNTVTGISLLSGVGIEIKDNTISLSSAATTSSIVGITCTFTGGSAANPQIATITGNTIQNVTHNTATSGGFTGITSGSGGTGSVVTISSNIVQNNTLTGTGTFTGIANTATSGTLIMNNNIASGNTKSGTGTMTLLDAGSIGTSTTATINSNQVTGNQMTGASGTMNCTRAGTTQVTYNGNIVNNNSIPSTSGASSSAIYGYINVASPTVENISNNQIDNLSIGGVNASTANIVEGIHTFAVATTVKTISGNSIHDLTMAPAGTVRGILQDAGTANIFKNKIYDLSSTSANAAALVEGINIASGVSSRIYNNLIGNLYATATSGANAVRGIASIASTGTGTVNVYFNTIYLSGTSSGDGFGSSGIFHTASATATVAALDMRNNIVINSCTPTGTGRAVAYRRSSTALANFATSSNNNIYYVDPDVNNHIFSDGTNHLDLAGYKALSGVSPRETYSQTENVVFQSITGSDPVFLKVDPGTPTFAESGAQPISGIADDYFATVRNTSTPDIGAHEDQFINAGPVIASVGATPALPQCVATARTITATITAGLNEVSSVTLNYAYAGVAQTPVSMTGGPTTYIGILPAASPNVLVTWSVTVTDNQSNANTSAGTSFTDAYLTTLTVNASANATSLCSGSSVQLTGSIIGPIAAAPAANTYCASTHASGCNNDNITRVVLSNIDNATSGCGGASHYTYFNGGGAQTTNLAATVSNTLSVSFGADANQYFGAWIDYDHSGTYDASEFLGASGNAGANGTASVSFSIPVTVMNGLTHIRIVGGNDAVVTATQACGVSSSPWGETQDYDVTITGATASVPLPVTYTWKDVENNTIGTTKTITVTPSATSFYNLTITDANGCKLTGNTVAVAVNAPAISGTTTICTGGSVTLSAPVQNSIPAALVFDGVDDYTEGTVTGIPLGNTARTMEAWVKTNQVTNGVIFNWGTSDVNQRCGLMVVNSRLYFVGQSNELAGNAMINDNQWHHVAASFNGTTLSLYVDGVLDVSKTTTLNTTGDVLRIGTRTLPGDGEYFNGQIDEVRIWNVARSQSAIQLDKTNAIAANSAGLVAYYKMNEAAGTNIYNAVNGADPATLFNGPVWNTTATTPVLPFSPNTTGYLWSTGATTPSIPVSLPGDYSVAVTYTGGLTCNTSPVTTSYTLSIGSLSGAASLCVGATTPYAANNVVYATGNAGQQAYINGNLNTGSTTLSGVAAPSGYNWSELQNNTGNLAEANGSLGTSALVNSFSLADDFTVPAGPSWNISRLVFYAYQTGAAATPSPFNELRFRIYNGDPSTGTASIVFGDLTTNRLSATNDAHSYRIANTIAPSPGSASGTARKIWTLEADVNISLPAGVYWIEWQTNNIANSNHFVPPSAVTGVRTVSGYNALQRNISTNTWVPVFDDGFPTTAANVALDFPFTVYHGTATWSSSNNAIATVDPATGIVTGISPGTATITFTITGGGCSPVSASQNITINSNPVSVSIAASPSNIVCAGTAVTFTATPTNGGANPLYQWYKNGNMINAETNSTYISNTLINSDVITVQLTSDASCTTNNPATSNSITMWVNALPTAIINASGPTTFCNGGSVTLSTPINAGSMLLFNGTNNYVSGPDDVVPVTGDYTVSVWAKQLNSHPGQYSQIFAQGRQLYLGPGADGIIRAGDSWGSTGVTFPTDQQWHHYTIVRTSTNTYLYLDGNLAATKGSPIPSPASNGIDPNNLMIGSQWFPGEIFDGYVDELQVWNVARTQSEIQAGMHISQSNNAPGLVAYFTFNEGAGSLTSDITANGYAATLVNNPAWSASTALPSIQWNLNGSPISGETGSSYVANTAGNYTVTLTSAQGCVATSAVTSVTVNTCPNFATLNLKLFIQGYYQNIGTAAPMDNFGDGGCLFKNGLSANATDADNVEVSLMSAEDGSLIESQNGVLQTNGTMSVNFAASRAGNSYYLRIRHRNSVETWSAAPVEMSASTNYDFSTAANMAYGDNQVKVETDVWAIYSGDIIDADTQTPGVQDGVIESSDYSLMENDVYNVTGGYVPADITGDGVVESADYSIMENNVYLVIGVLRPF